jgi:uracil-DNA glycosylase family 4
MECKLCPLSFNTNYKPINSIGNIDTAKVMIVFYSPTEKDISNKEVYITLVLEKLYFALSIVNFSKDDIYITFLLKCKNKLKNTINDESYLKTCNIHFQRELNTFKEGIVILVGSKTINFILSDKFYLIRDYGKLLTNSNFCFVNLPSLNHLFKNPEQELIMDRLLVKSYYWYRNHIDINHKSIYHGCRT